MLFKYLYLLKFSWIYTCYKTSKFAITIIQYNNTNFTDFKTIKQILQTQYIIQNDRILAASNPTMIKIYYKNQNFALFRFRIGIVKCKMLYVQGDLSNNKNLYIYNK